MLSPAVQAPKRVVSLQIACRGRVAMDSPLGHPHPQKPLSIPPPLNVRKPPAQVGRKVGIYARAFKDNGAPKYPCRSFGSTRQLGTTKKVHVSILFPQIPLFPTATTTAPLCQDCPRIDSVAFVRERKKARRLWKQELSAPKEPRRRVVPHGSDSKI